MAAPEPARVREQDESIGEVTALLRKWSCEDPDAREQVLAVTYGALRKIAQSRMRGEKIDHLLQPTALVNECFLRLARTENLQWRNRAHFLAVASTAMRRLLIDYARAESAVKSGGDVAKVQMEGLDVPAPAPALDLAMLNELLDKLAKKEPRMAMVVDMYCFGGLTFGEIGDSLAVDERTVKRDWTAARAWLRGMLSRRGSEPDDGPMVPG